MECVNFLQFKLEWTTLIDMLPQPVNFLGKIRLG